MRRPDRHPEPRRGATWPAIACALCVSGTVITTAAVVTPRYVRADTDQTAVPARVVSHQQVFEAFTGLVGRSREVVAVNQRGATPFLEFVLWIEDAEQPGVIDPQEIAVITHSEVLQTITMHAIENPRAEMPRETSAEGLAVDEPEPLRRSDIRAPGFCARFRDQPGVKRRVLAKGIARLFAEPFSEGTAGAPMLRISLTWDKESADGADEASALMHVRMRTDDDAQTE